MSNIKIIDREFGLSEMNGMPAVGSRKVAQVFDKRHDRVLRKIAEITDPNFGVSEKFASHNFLLGEYKDSMGRKLPEYFMTKDGFVILVMGFTGQKAIQFKEAYIEKFNNMEQYITSLNAARLECPELTQAILEAHDEPQYYHFSNELDLFNRSVLGMTAKQYKEIHGLGKVKSIRPYLSAEQVMLIEKLQRTDIGLVLTESDFQKRKRTLEWYHVKLKEKINQKQLPVRGGK